MLEIQNKKILLTHGHRYRVKYGYDRLLSRAKEISADIVVFGHTHVPENTYIDNILLFNPKLHTAEKWRPWHLWHIRNYQWAY